MAVATDAAGAAIGTTSSSSFATDFAARRRRRTFCDSLSESPAMRAVPRCTVMLVMPRRTHSTRNRATSSSATAGAGGGP